MDIRDQGFLFDAFILNMHGVPLGNTDNVFIVMSYIKSSCATKWMYNPSRAIIDGFKMAVNRMKRPQISKMILSFDL